MHLPVISIVVFNRRHNRPPACWRVLQVFLDRIVALLPAVERLVAEKTHDIVRVIRVRLVEEPGPSKLIETRQL